ncbi:bifunctional alpha/beta hydrolase/class I SAM-dependent methyltransferase [Campylobacter sp. MOP7]|uniref:bifunctional alpha/beta hydrolase/class I SAM-dependent methyltransferase n=1 Tax=Campylobacter canis TaxID=3378588 RepID=UPI00387E3E04
MQEKTFLTSDGAELFYRHKSPSDQGQNGNSNSAQSSNLSPQKAIVLFHRGHEHSGRMMFMSEELNLSDFHFFAWDARGHGKSPGERGDAPSIGRLVSDVDEFIDHISKEYDIAKENIAVIAQSVGAVLVATWLHDYAPKIRCAVLASPAFDVKLYVPFAKEGLALLYKFKGNFFVNSYVKANYLTHNKERINSYNEDSLIARAISVRILLGLYEASKRVVGDAAAITTPLQLLISGDDWVVNHAPQHEFYNSLGSHIKERHVMKGFYHDTLGEQDRHLAFKKIENFINERFSKPLSEVDCTQADKFGFSREEADRLATPLCKFHPKNICFSVQRFGMKLLSPWVKGLKIGEDRGYDSGSTLDYVYQNQPQGSNAFVKWVDKIYLNSIGWRGIRKRKENIAHALNFVMNELKQKGERIEILDIASGHGRYILDALSGEIRPEKILLRDYDKVNVKAGQELIKERNLEDIATFEEANAFHKASYENLENFASVGVVSGLFELFSDNALIRVALEGFGRSVRKGGYLIYTNQPYHPQLEMIARALSSHRDGEAWIMRRRSVVEMDQLVSRAGFKKIHQWIDEDGIFTVSVAVKE